MNPVQFDTIVTHDSRAHLDDLLATCLAVRVNPKAIVYRVNVISDIQLNNPKILVLDKGTQLDPDKLNFDHHQDENLDCAFILFAKHLGLTPNLFDAFSWARVVNYNDTKGMLGVAKKFGFSDDQKTLSNLGCVFKSSFDSMILDWFSEQDTIHPGSKLHDILYRMGDFIISGCEEVEAAHKKYEETVEIRTVEVAGRTFTYADKMNTGEEMRAFGSWLSKKVPDGIDFVLAADDRTKGCIRLIRYNNDIDFRKWANYEEKSAMNRGYGMSQYPNANDVNFCHANGFLLSLKPTEFLDLYDIIGKSYAPKSPKSV